MSEKKAAPVVAKRSGKDGHVAVGITLKAYGWSSERVQVNAGTDLTTAQARALAQALVALAEEADAKVAQKEAAEDRRRKWREREVAAGRMVIFEGPLR